MDRARVNPAKDVSAALVPEVTTPFKYPVPFSITSPDTSIDREPPVSTVIPLLISIST